MKVWPPKALPPALRYLLSMAILGASAWLAPASLWGEAPATSPSAGPRDAQVQAQIKLLGDTGLGVREGATRRLLEIGAGQTMYFTLVGNVSVNTNNGSWTITATLQGDGTRQLGVVQAGNVSPANFVWSPNATTTALSTTNDWTNGYGVPGLPSTGI